jgi:hypothetical protein
MVNVCIIEEIIYKIHLGEKFFGSLWQWCAAERCSAITGAMWDALLNVC